MKSRIEKRKVEIIVDLFLLIFIPILAGGIYQYGNAENHRVESLSDGWYQVVAGKKESLSLPAEITAGEDGKISLYHDSLTEEEAGQVLSVQNVQDELQISVGNQTLYAYESVLFERNEQMQGKLWADVVLPDEITTETISINYTCDAGETVFVESPYVGNMQGIISLHIQDNWFSIFVIAGMFALGIITILIFLYGSFHGMKDLRLLDVAVFLVVCAIWCVTDSSLYQMYGENTGAGSIISFYCFMLLPIPMIHFIQNTGNIKKNKILDVFLGLFYANAVVQGLVHEYFNLTFVSMLPVTHVLLFVAVLSVFFLLWKEYKKEPDEQVRIAIMAFGTLGGSGLIALVLYWMLQIHWYEVIFQIGILIAMGIMSWGIVRKITDEKKVQTEEAIYERLSNVDGLTGLKNKKAFEKYLIMVQGNAEHPHDTILVYIDLEGVRRVNENYGSAAGDEMIIAAARCIKRTCDIFERNIQCFRVHGDEFAVVLLPGINKEEWERRLQREAERYNRFGHHQIRLVCGYGYLEGMTGNIRNLSQWKGHADDNLRKNKEQ